MYLINHVTYQLTPLQRRLLICLPPRFIRTAMHIFRLSTISEQNLASIIDNCEIAVVDVAIETHIHTHVHIHRYAVIQHIISIIRILRRLERWIC